MENITFNLLELHKYGTAFSDYLALRKHFFVDTLGWGIPHNDRVEMDQYDNPLAYYSLVLQDGKLVGGARAMPTTSMWGQHSYMLRDALKGKLAGIPDSIMGQDYNTPKVWECTRLVVSDDLQTTQERQRCLGLIVDGLSAIARDQGGSELIALMRPSFLRALRQLGYAADRIGAPYYNSEDGRQYAVLQMSVAQPANALAKLRKRVTPRSVPQKVALRESA
ncbi:MAG: autoinducer synthase [Rhodobacterales bacterium]|nr:MAG: autoinducer synthase [Rhodobacterales bacterium]